MSDVISAIFVCLDNINIKPIFLQPTVLLTCYSNHGCLSNGAPALPRILTGDLYNYIDKYKVLMHLCGCQTAVGAVMREMCY